MTVEVALMQLTAKGEGSARIVAAKRRYRGLIALAAVCALFLALKLWPRGPALVLYTSPPIALNKKTFRLQALVPAGLKFSLPKAEGIANSFVHLDAEQSDPWGWLPGWSRQFLVPSHARLGVTLFANAGAPHLISRTHVDYGNGMVFEARKGVDAHRCQIVFWCDNQGVFNNTHRRICESFRVELAGATQNEK